MAIITVLALPLIILLPADETSNELYKIDLVGIILLGALGVVGNAILGSWIGWGVAHWRFRERPAGVWPFWLWPAVTGALLYGGMMLSLMLLIGSIGDESVSSGEKVLGVVFATACGPFLGMFGAAIFRYALHVTALGSGREFNEEGSDSEK